MPGLGLGLVQVEFVGLELVQELDLGQTRICLAIRFMPAENQVEFMSG